MRLLARWFKRSRRKLRRAARPSRPHEERLPDDEPPPPGCGWFDSSHELMRGLVVIEAAIVLAPHAH